MIPIETIRSRAQGLFVEIVNESEPEIKHKQEDVFFTKFVRKIIVLLLAIYQGNYSECHSQPFLIIYYYVCTIAECPYFYGKSLPILPEKR
jgi:hypothetical protein